MNRRNFVLSWGRKIFFGLSWPLSTLIALIFLKSYILPQNATDWLYYLTTLIGHYGLATALVYFLLYSPVVLLMPTYYVSRIWSVVLILTLNFLLLMDATSFSSYQFHIYSFIWKLLMQGGLTNLFGAKATTIAIVGAVIIAILLWLRGESVWSHMQTRFSNPVKNWYLVLIVLCLIIGKSIYYYGNIDPRMSSLFPLDFNPKRETENKMVDNRRLYYPSSKIACGNKNNPNLVMIVIKEWAKGQFNPDLMPNVFHMKRHGVSFNSHYGVSTDANGGIFSLYYSIPSSYQTTARETLPVLMTEFAKRQYEIVDFGNDVTSASSRSEHDENTLKAFKDWTDNRSQENIRPYSLNLTFVQHASEVDKLIQDIILKLQREELLKDSYVILTGGYPGNSERTVPFLLFTPGRKSSEINHITSHYDVVPTLMENGWGCKKAFESASIGKSLFEEGREWLLISGEDHFKILDFKNSVMTSVKDGEISDESLGGNSGDPRHELIFQVLKINTQYSKPN